MGKYIAECGGCYNDYHVDDEDIYFCKQCDRYVCYQCCDADKESDPDEFIITNCQSCKDRSTEETKQQILFCSWCCWIDARIKTTA